MKKSILLLMACSIGLVLLLIARAFYTHELAHTYLLWNLFLAWIPVFPAMLIYKSVRMDWSTALCLLIWLAFFPNCAYLVTDLVHLRLEPGSPIWVDIVALFSFAFIGLLLGVLSMRMVHTYIARRLAPGMVHFILFFICCASGYGIYIGRFLRLNSWDLFFDPIGTLARMSGPILSPGEAGWAIAFSGMMAAIMLCSYYFFTTLSDNSPADHEKVLQ